MYEQLLFKYLKAYMLVLKAYTPGLHTKITVIFLVFFLLVKSFRIWGYSKILGKNGP